MGRGDYTRTDTKCTADVCTGITTVFLRQLGRLKHGFQQSGGFNLAWHSSRTRKETASMYCRITPDAATFSYYLKRDEGQMPVSHTIPFTWTACNYGGRRTWFLCQCGRRVGKVFFRGERYGCRHCFNLTYQSRLDCQINRAWGKIHNIGKRLKLEDSLIGSLYYLPPARPKWMQRRRYEMLCCNLQHWYYRKNRAFVDDFERMFPGRLGRV
jgi:hypothetical protein